MLGAHRRGAEDRTHRPDGMPEGWGRPSSAPSAGPVRQGCDARGSVTRQSGVTGLDSSTLPRGLLIWGISASTGSMGGTAGRESSPSHQRCAGRDVGNRDGHLGNASDEAVVGAAPQGVVAGPPTTGCRQNWGSCRRDLVPDAGPQAGSAPVRLASPSVPLVDDGQRTVSVQATFLAHGAEHESLEATKAPRADDEQLRSFAGLDERVCR